MYLCIFYIFKN